MKGLRLIGPFVELLSMQNMSVQGALADSQLEVTKNGGILISDDRIQAVGRFEDLLAAHELKDREIELIHDKMVALPGFIDPHTHIAFGGSRASDFAKRLGGKTYLEISAEGGGIWDTVVKTRQASFSELVDLICKRAMTSLENGVTTIEVKSGYGLNVKDELRILRAIAQADRKIAPRLIPTCLAAHMVPKDFDGVAREYVEYLITELFPKIVQDGLCDRADIFIEQGAFDVDSAEYYLKSLKEMGFKLTIHADQFSVGGSELGVRMEAISVDHLEASKEREIEIIAGSKTVAVALPGASLGLGEPFTPARKLLDAGACVAIGSDWNPGSAPMGHLLTAASVLATFEHLTMAETLAGLTFRAAHALGLQDVGRIQPGFQADIIGFNCTDYREILYHQGQLNPGKVWKSGSLISNGTET